MENSTTKTAKRPFIPPTLEIVRLGENSIFLTSTEDEYYGKGTYNDDDFGGSSTLW